MRPVKANETHKPYTAQSPYRLREIFIPRPMNFFWPAFPLACFGKFTTENPQQSAPTSLKRFWCKLEKLALWR
jgi:hypothetical protein